MKKILTLLSGVIALSTQATASITINMFAGELRNPSPAFGGNGGIAAAGTLLQLVNLGPNGIFDEINIGDPTSTGIERWVSGDDSVINLPFGGDFPSAAAFDFNAGNDGSAGPGTLDRVFVFALNAVPAGTKIGLRWFPGLAASNFASINLALDQRYGQFTRQSDTPAQHGGELWVAPLDGSIAPFDSFASQSIGGADSDARSFANLAVVPEPASIALSLIGAAGLAMLRRRRS